MKIVVLGASSPYALSFLKKNSSKITHLLLQTKKVASLQKHLPLLGLNCPVEIIEGDFLQPQENYLDIFEQYLQRLEQVDAIVFSCGQWQAHQQIEHICHYEHIKSWQVNYLLPISLMRKIIPFLKKNFALYHNHLCTQNMKSALNSLNLPVAQAVSIFLEGFCLENHGQYYPSHLTLYQSHQSAKLFSDLEKIKEQAIPEL